MKESGTSAEAGGAALSEPQQRLVSANIGLVGVHLKRRVFGTGRRSFERDWDDLFQAGCLGLIAAAQAWRADGGIPFAAFAITRIQRAVGLALAFEEPGRGTRRPRARGHNDESARDHPRTTRRSWDASVDAYVQTRRARRPRGHDPGGPGLETVGERLHGKYERAVYRAGRLVSARSRRRSARGRLVDVLIEERLRVADDEWKTAQREVARRTGASGTGVARCERQLTAAARQLLELDAEFVELVRLVRHHPGGTERGIDGPLESHLAQTCAVAFIERFGRTDGDARGAMLRALGEAAGEGFHEVIRAVIVALDCASRERVALTGVDPCRALSGR
ncbi:MAG: sigma factor [Phycisphaerae bacterium]